MDLNLLVSKIIEMKSGAPGLKIATSQEVASAAAAISEERLAKAPKPIEMGKADSFSPKASDIEADYRIESKAIETTEGNVNGFVEYFRNRLERIREMLMLRNYTITKSIETLRNYTDGREVVVVGMVNSRITTKNRNIMVLMEDATGEAKVIFMNSNSKESADLFASASRLVNDEVVAIRGKLSGPFIMAREILWPGVPIKEEKHIKDDIAIAFISDIHVGSKTFLERNFAKMLDWLNGNVDSGSRALAGKVKYLVVGGDVVDGIGVYPEQEKDLAILDIYQQYRVFAGFLESIPDYIHVFILPGDHDAVQTAEPQPAFPSELIKTNRDNVHFVTNPSYITVHGISILSYHGAGIISMLNSIPGLSYSRPEEAMIEMLKRRHLSPIYGGNMVVPSKDDNLVIQAVPDILHMGHIHKNGIANYHGVNVVNSGAWQGRTEYQVKRGLVPSPCNLPVFEAKKYAFTTIDFSDGA
jgi:DNA polymerase II small subunit